MALHFCWIFSPSSAAGNRIDAGTRRRDGVIPATGSRLSGAEALAVAHASQIAAAQLVCGIDLEAVFDGDTQSARAAVGRLERAIERERLKGWRRHWSYDLNRHIALKQALDRLRAALPPAAVSAKSPEAKNGA